MQSIAKSIRRSAPDPITDKVIDELFQKCNICPLAVAMPGF
jgi:hypothetical protein